MQMLGGSEYRKAIGLPIRIRGDRVLYLATSCVNHLKAVALLKLFKLSRR